jgi:flagellar hook-basal body complex protein FliE
MNDLNISNLQSILPQIEHSKDIQSSTEAAPFSSYVKGMLKDTNATILEADRTINDLVTGRDQDVHNTMIAMQKAEISFELIMQIRNKLIAAYDEIRKMTI